MGRVLYLVLIAAAIALAQTLPLQQVYTFRCYTEPLPNATVVVFSSDGKVLAAVKTDQQGRILTPLPKGIVKVAWGNSWELYQRTGNQSYLIWVYDQTILRDRQELGDPELRPYICTWVYPLTVTVYDYERKPAANLFVEVRDYVTNGKLVYYIGRTGADGTVGPFTVPATSYYYYVYDQRGILVAVGRFDIPRGGTIPGGGWNVAALVVSLSEVSAKNIGTVRGFIVVNGVQFINGTSVNMVLPFTVSNGVLKVQGELPLSHKYPVEVYVTHVTLGGQEVPVKGGKFLAYSGYTTDLFDGLDFAELSLTSVVSISAIDTAGAPRSDWTVQVLYGNITVAEGRGTVNAVLPRTDVLGQPYIVRVLTDIVTPGGRRLVKEEPLNVTQRTLDVKIPVSTVRVVVQVVDGFGRPRDWPVEVEGFAEGRGTLEVVLLEGQRYVAKATGLGFVNVTEFVARGPEMVVAVKIPTAWITARVVDESGEVRDWPVEVVGVAAGRGVVSVEVPPGRYTVKATAFGREYTQTVEVKPGQNQTVTIQVPTANVAATSTAEERQEAPGSGRRGEGDRTGGAQTESTAPQRGSASDTAGAQDKGAGQRGDNRSAPGAGEAQTAAPSADLSSQTPIIIAVAVIVAAVATAVALLKRRR